MFSPVDGKTLYASSQHLWRTTNGGQSWEKISPNLTRSDPKTMQASGGPITKDQTGVETYAVIFTVAPSRQDASTIWTGSDDGWVHVTRDGGTNWEKVTPPDLPDFTRISLIEPSPHQNGVAHLAGNRYQMGDRKPYLYKTSDFGKSWTKIVTVIPENLTSCARSSRIPSGLADTEFGLAANSHGAMAPGIDAHITYQVAVQAGDVLTANATEITRSRRLGVYRVDVTRADGTPVSSFTATVHVTSQSHDARHA